MKDFREQLFLVHLRIGEPAAPEYVQEQAEQCCKVWGHDYVHGGFVLSPLPQTIGGTPVVSDLQCRRCGQKRHPSKRE